MYNILWENYMTMVSLSQNTLLYWHFCNDMRGFNGDMMRWSKENDTGVVNCHVASRYYVRVTWAQALGWGGSDNPNLTILANPKWLMSGSCKQDGLLHAVMSHIPGKMEWDFITVFRNINLKIICYWVLLLFNTFGLEFALGI